MELLNANQSSISPEKDLRRSRNHNSNGTISNHDSKDPNLYKPKRRQRPSIMDRILKACLTIESGKGSIWRGGLGNAVYLRIKLCNRIGTYGPSASRDNLQDALELLHPAIQLQKEAEETPSPHFSLLSNNFVGSHCLLVSVLMRLGKMEEASTAARCVTDKLEDLYEQTTGNAKNNTDCSILFGLAGGLQALWFLRRELGDDSFGSDLALTMSYSILLEGLQDNDNYGMPLLWDWNLWPYLGAGTGAVGVLYALLGHTDDEWANLGDCLPNAREIVRESIDGLACHLYETTGNLKDSVGGFEESDRSVGWTHGGAGYCLLLLKAFGVYGDEKYVHWAVEFADEVLWPNRTRCEGPGLARGAPGIAYVFLAMARVDFHRSGLWKQRARDVAATVLAETRSVLVHPQNNNYSLFDGIGGLASLLIDLEDLETTKTTTPWCYFPFFESCQANLCRKFEYLTKREDHPRLFSFRIERKNSTCDDNREAKRAFLQSKPPARKTSPAATLSTTETATTALTTSVSTNPSRNPHRSGNASNDAFQLSTPRSIHASDRAALDVSHLTMDDTSNIPIVVEAAPPRPFMAASPPGPSIPEEEDSLIRTTRKVSVDTPPARRTANAKPPPCWNDCAYDEAFMTDSVERKQRAEKSWIQHFGTREQKLQYKHCSGSTYNATCSGSRSRRNFRHMVGGFSSLPESGPPNKETTACEL
ncbi:unnamed protein product [Pseudo-nitzschia multistriata]|uniref:Uncharacterized protein n=1 Tax=Pseudo-nitzschia multistriata TaxID=183589 RepID=A0A448YWE7_9STRA|nr:unnamed protein product [Pseudo-nitzschia multistriata]